MSGSLVQFPLLVAVFEGFPRPSTSVPAAPSSEAASSRATPVRGKNPEIFFCVVETRSADEHRIKLRRTAETGN
jgi:hypothetical protein